MKKLIVIGIVVLSIVLIIFFSRRKVTYVPKGELTDTMVDNAFNTLNDSLIDKRYTYIDFLKTVDLDYNLNDITATLTNSNSEITDDYPSNHVLIDFNQHAIYEVNVDKAGYYYLKLDYITDSDSLNDIVLSLSVNGEYQYDESQIINIPLRWEDSTKDFVKDSYGDETLPTSVKIKEWTSLFLYNNTYDTVEPLLFYFDEGVNTIDLENISSDTLRVGSIKLIAPKDIPTYDEYFINKIASKKSQNYVNAIDYLEKNSSYIRMNYANEPSLTPYDAVDRVLNVIDGASWDKAGQQLTYEINVKETGNYKLAFYYQNTKNDFNVFRTIRIDDEIPFAEMKSYEFPVTKSNKWKTEILSDKNNQPYEFFLTEGKHKISITADYEPVSESIRNIQLVLDHINKFSLDIIKITGKEVDKNRTWKFTRTVPETDLYLESYEIIIKDIISDLVEYAPNEEKSATLSYLQKALYTLNKLRENPDKLPLYLEDLSTGTGSIAQMLGDSINMLRDQPLTLDGFYFYNVDKFDAPKANFFKRIWSSIKSFTSSFTSDKYSPKIDPEIVDIWVNKPITYVDIMQKLADSTFTPETGIKVKISVMPDVNRLILASAAKEAPDVALGLPSYMPYDFAIRNASYDLTQFEDFWSVAGNFAPGAFVPYVLNDSVYAIPESLDFNAIIYRKDTLKALNLEVPDNWDEVIEILPELQRYGMNFYHPIASGSGTKWFYQTSPFIYQHNGTIYSEDGLKTTIDSPNSSAGLTFLNSLFTTYSLPEQVQSFYNSFRYNELPIGIVDFTTYLQIKNAAPELTGQWALSDNPGTLQEDGSINRSYIANGTAGIIMRTSDKEEESWEFLKWWMSKEIQTNFAYTLQSTYGPEFVWLSGNVEAVKEAPIEKKDKDVIIRQIEWLVDVPRTPGQYMLERGLSDIWNTAVFEGTATRVAIDRQIIIINREITRKMIEFGFIDEKGNVLKTYIIRDVDWVKKQMDEARK